MPTTLQQRFSNLLIYPPYPLGIWGLVSFPLLHCRYSATSPPGSHSPAWLDTLPRLPPILSADTRWVPLQWPVGHTLLSTLLGGSYHRWSVLETYQGRHCLPSRVAIAILRYPLVVPESHMAVITTGYVVLKSSLASVCKRYLVAETYSRPFYCSTALRTYTSQVRPPFLPYFPPQGQLSPLFRTYSPYRTLSHVAIFCRRGLSVHTSRLES